MDSLGHECEMMKWKTKFCGTCLLSGCLTVSDFTFSLVALFFSYLFTVFWSTTTRIASPVPKRHSGARAHWGCALDLRGRRQNCRGQFARVRVAIWWVIVSNPRNTCNSCPKLTIYTLSFRGWINKWGMIEPWDGMWRHEGVTLSLCS